MMELRKTCFLRDRVRSRHVAAGFVELTGQLIRDELDGRWWKTPPGSVSGNDEGDRHWCWLDLWQEIADDDKWDAIGIMTSDGRLQGAMIYRIDADSFMEPGKQAVYVDNLATAPWNRPTVTESCRYSGVGSELLLQAIHHSHLLLHDGRLNLATLPDSFGFYESHGFRDTGAIIEGLRSCLHRMRGRSFWTKESFMKKTLPASDPTFDYLPPTAGVRLPKEMQHPMPPLGAKPTSPLNKHILRLRALHPEIEWKYQPEEIVKLDEASLKALLREVNQKLGIR